MEKISRRIVGAALVLITVFACSREKQEQTSSPQPQADQAKVSKNKYVVADYKLLFNEQLPINLTLSLQNETLKLLVVNHSSKSLFANQNILLQGMAGVPLIFLIVKDDSQQALYVCGHFEDPPSAYKNVEIQPNGTASFVLSVAELKRRYCVDSARVSVHVVDPIGRNFASFAKSNEISIR
jgi:hypothetical protein